jgi:hypothetical protein
MLYIATKCPDVTVGTVLLAQKWSRDQEAASEGSSYLGCIFMLKALGIAWDHIPLVTGVGTTWVHIVLVAALENTWDNIPLLPAVGTAWGNFSPSFCSFICTVLSNTISVTQALSVTHTSRRIYFPMFSLSFPVGIFYHNRSRQPLG